MACYSMSCAIYSFCVEKLVKKFRAKPVYVGGQLVYCVGMIFMALTRTKWGVLFFSWSAGIMYSTLFTMPYIIVAHYHETNTVRKNMRLSKNIVKLCQKVVEQGIRENHLLKLDETFCRWKYSLVCFTLFCLVKRIVEYFAKE